MPTLPYLDAATIRAALPWSAAIEAIAAAVPTPGAPTAPARTVLPTRHGELMLMPAETDAELGVKVLTIAPDDPGRELPRIHAVYVLFDARSLAPLALLDGGALTLLRTPAVSAFAARALAIPTAATLTMFGAGPQAEAHVVAMSAIRPIEAVTIVGRDRERAAALVARLVADGHPATLGSADSVRAADIVVCATTAREPLFDGSLLAPHACVIAVGSHERDARELDDTVFRRATAVVVEDVATALREAGDVVLAIGAGALVADDLIALDELSSLDRTPGISVVKSVGVGWQDLAVAAAAYHRSGS